MKTKRNRRNEDNNNNDKKCWKSLTLKNVTISWTKNDSKHVQCPLSIDITRDVDINRNKLILKWIKKKKGKIILNDGQEDMQYRFLCFYFDSMPWNANVYCHTRRECWKIEANQPVATTLQYFCLFCFCIKHNQHCIAAKLFGFSLAGINHIFSEFNEPKLSTSISFHQNNMRFSVFNIIYWK